MNPFNMVKYLAPFFNTILSAFSLNFDHKTQVLEHNKDKKM